MLGEQRIPACDSDGFHTISTIFVTIGGDDDR